MASAVYVTTPLQVVAEQFTGGPMALVAVTSVTTNYDAAGNPSGTTGTVQSYAYPGTSFAMNNTDWLVQYQTSEATYTNAQFTQLFTILSGGTAGLVVMQRPDPGDPMTADLSICCAGDVSHGMQVAWGDATTTDMTGLFTNKPNKTTHTYANPGNFTITVKLWSATVGTALATQTVQFLAQQDITAFAETDSQIDTTVASPSGSSASSPSVGLLGEAMVLGGASWVPGIFGAPTGEPASDVLTRGVSGGGLDFLAKETEVGTLSSAELAQMAPESEQFVGGEIPT